MSYCHYTKVPPSSQVSTSSVNPSSVYMAVGLQLALPNIPCTASVFFSFVQIKLSHVYQKCLGPEVFGILRMFSSGCGPFACVVRDLRDGELSINATFIYILYVPYARSPKVVLYKFFNNSVHEARFSGMEFSTCSLMSFLVIYPYAECRPTIRNH